MEQCSSSSEHFDLCCPVPSSAPHWQIVFVAGSTKLAMPVRRRLRHCHIVHPEFDSGGSFSSGVMFKRVVCGIALNFRFYVSFLQVEIFLLGVLHSVESTFLISVWMGKAGG